MRNALIVTLLACIVSACSSSSSSKRKDASKDTSAEITLHDFRTGAHMAIVNDAHLVQLGIVGETPEARRLEYYSAVRGESAPKVTTNEIMDALITYLNDTGFQRLAADGPVEAAADGSISIEVRDGSAARHAVRQRGMQAADARSFNQLVVAFYETYNAIPQHQAYEGQPREKVFKKPQGQN